MKITAIIMLFGCLAASAKGNAQKVTFSGKNVPLETVFTAIKKQTGYVVFYEYSILAEAKLITVDVKNVTVEKLLDECFKQQPFIYAIEGKTILVTKKDAAVTPEELPQPPPPIDVTGRVVNEKGEPVAGASVQVKGEKNKGTSTDVNGFFTLKGIDENTTLIISAVNIEEFSVKVNGKADLATLVVKTKITTSEEIRVRTGYQTLDPNKATGSYVVISKAELDQRVATNIIDKLEGIVPSLVFNRTPQGIVRMRIRGESTINGYTEPLIILDNFRYDGDIMDINPNDVESITILRDAAAASMSGGAQSGNGVIVITTKSGKFNQPFRVNLSVNTTQTDKPDLYYSPAISSSEQVDFEIFLFKQGKYNPLLTNPAMPVISPVAEILNSRNLGIISANDSSFQIDALRTNDWRKEFLEHIYRKNISRQYSLNLSGGSSKANYYLSAGYDKSLSSIIGNESSRFTLSNKVSYNPFKNFKINLTIGYSENNSVSHGSDIVPSLYPYQRLFDDNGNQIAIPQHRSKWEDTIVNYGFMSMKYFPIQERENGEGKVRGFQTRVGVDIGYSFLKDFRISVSYQYLRIGNRISNLSKAGGYYIRQRANTFAILQNGRFVGSNYPSQGELQMSTSDRVSHNGRINLDYNRNWGHHSIISIAGIEVRDTRSEINAFKYFGYNDETGSFVNPDLQTQFPTYTGLVQVGNSAIGTTGLGYSATNIRFRSFFANASYEYRKKYGFSASARYDQANIFGVKTNNKGKPLWTIGARWDISKEKFYKVKYIKDVTLRVTYGYQGNISPSAVAVTTIRYRGNASYTGLPWAEISNFPNPQLRWEKSGQLNIGVNFVTKDEIFSGSFDFFKKIGKDLMGETRIDPTTGISILHGNFSGMKSEGYDVSITARIINKDLKWVTTVNLSHASEKVTNYDRQAVLSVYKNGYFDPTPIVGYPLYSTFSYNWAGLNPTNGNPMVYLGDTINQSYNSTTSQGIKPSDLVYGGRFYPIVTGSVSNRISWKDLSLTFNLVYKLGYHFRRSTIKYGVFVNDWMYGHSDFSLRWQKPGDEQYTNVPSFVYPIPNALRQDFYENSSILMEKGDHVRLQFINLNYTLSQKLASKFRLQSLSVFFYANNLGIIWKANDKGLDPDFPYLRNPPPKSFSFGVQTTF